MFGVDDLGNTQIDLGEVVDADVCTFSGCFAVLFLIHGFVGFLFFFLIIGFFSLGGFCCLQRFGIGRDKGIDHRSLDAVHQMGVIVDTMAGWQWLAGIGPGQRCAVEE